MYRPITSSTNEMPWRSVEPRFRPPIRTVYAKYGLVTEVVGVAKRDLKPRRTSFDGLAGRCSIYLATSLSIEMPRRRNVPGPHGSPARRQGAANPSRRISDHTRKAVKIKTDTTLINPARPAGPGAAVPAPAASSMSLWRQGAAHGYRRAIDRRIWADTSEPRSSSHNSRRRPRRRRDIQA